MNEKSTASLSPDTEAILLLCGRFGSERGERHAPLTQKEYERLTKWLLECNLRPGDLLGGAVAGRLGALVHAGLEPARVESLIARGTALALALEKWQRSGLWVLSRSDAAYPRHLKKKLGQSAPPLLYGAGETSLLDAGGLAVVGSRNASEAALEFTRDVARACARDGLGVVSGGAKGVDVAAMQGASEAGGVVIGVLAADLLRASVNRQNRMGIQSGQLVLTSPFNPEAGFNAGNAMARNRYIYALADYALVVDSAEGEGGTWAGATENLRHAWTPLYVRTPGESPGNAALIAKGAQGFTCEISERASIREFLGKTCQSGTSSLFQQIVPDEGVATTEQPEPSPDTIDVVAAPGPENVAEAAPSAGLDTFQDFLAKLPLLLGEAPKNDEEIRLALGLEKGQLKVWLAAAVEQGFLEKRKKPVSYALPRQQALC
ncbi:MAG TPA: DNA-processing protein DprA [Acidiferrobacterales bacterium]|nr:DNA-processing protein DprA [Acidiferrobacterales bacterium]